MNECISLSTSGITSLRPTWPIVLIRGSQKKKKKMVEKTSADWGLEKRVGGSHLANPWTRGHLLSRIKTGKQVIHRHINDEEPLFSEPAVANLPNSGLGTAAAAATRGGWRRANYRGRLQEPRRATSRPARRHFCAKCAGLNHPLKHGKTQTAHSRPNLHSNCGPSAGESGRICGWQLQSGAQGGALSESRVEPK